MFTIRHECDGIDTFYEAEFLEYVGPLAKQGPAALLIRDPQYGMDAPARALSGGRAFIMNEQGATVGSYYLPDKTHPSDGQSD